MGTAPTSKSELLAAAQHLLTQDDHERTQRARLPRRHNFLTASLIACLVFLAIASALIATRQAKTSRSPEPTAKASANEVR